MTDTNPKQIAIGGLKIVAEAALAFLLVVGVCWGLCNWAEHQAARPIASAPDGVLLLSSSKATLAGSVELIPTDKEKQTGDFAYHFGRELLAERNSRTVRNWTGEDTSVAWSFVITPCSAENTKKPYKVNANLATPPQSVGNRFTVSIIDISNPDESSEIKRFNATVTVTGGWDKWQTVTLGQADLAPGTYRLVVAPEGAIKGGGLMGLGGIELQPVN